MMHEPRADGAARLAGHGHLRASHAEREQVVDTLKEAFVQGRLTEDELDSRVGHALVSRTHDDLAALTADLPEGPSTAQPPATAQPPRKPVPARPGRPESKAVKNGVRVIAAATVLTGSVWAGALLSNTGSQAVATLIWAFTFAWLGIVVLVGSVMLEARLRQRSARQLPPAPGQRGFSPS